MAREELTQRQAAERLDCSQTFLSLWLRGERELARDTEEHWAEVTEIPLRAFRLPREGDGAAA